MSKIYIMFIGSLKAGFVTERSKPGSGRGFRVQYPILSAAQGGIAKIYVYVSSRFVKDIKG